MKSLTPKDIGALARDARTELGMSQTQLGLKIGASRFWVAAFERGKSGVELGLVLKALRALRLIVTVESKAEVLDRGTERPTPTANFVDLSSIVGSPSSPFIFAPQAASPRTHSSLYSISARAPEALYPADKTKRRKSGK